jgi:hypothetical protein
LDHQADPAYDVFAASPAARRNQRARPLTSPAARLPSSFAFLRSWRRLAVAVLVGLSIASVALAPLQPTIDRVRQAAPWIGAGLAVSEILFVIGLGIMAWPVGTHIGYSPLGWRRRVVGLSSELRRTPVFWIGLAVNTAGAVGTGTVLLVVVVVCLPVTAWGLIGLVVGDLVMTVAVRAAILTGVDRAGRPDGGRR